MKDLKTINIIAICFLLLTFANADTNGIWHKAEDVRPGIFSLDENSTDNYSFNNKVIFNNITYFNDFVAVNKTNPQTNLDINGRWYVTSHGETPSSGVGMFGSYSHEKNAGIIQVWNYSATKPKNFSLQAAGGNVGIGLTSPESKLHIIGDVRWEGTLLEGEVPWERLINYVSVNAGEGLLGGGNLSENVTLSVNTSYFDDEYVNEGQPDSITSEMIVDGTIQAEDVDSSQIQLRVSSGCDEGQSIRVIEEGGSVICQDDNVDDDDNVVGNEYPLAGTGIIITNDREVNVDTNEIQRRVGNSCPTGQAISKIYNSGDVVCEEIPEPESVDLSEYQKRVSDSCTGGQAISAIDSNGYVTCVDTGDGGDGGAVQTLFKDSGEICLSDGGGCVLDATGSGPEGDYATVDYVDGVIEDLVDVIAEYLAENYATIDYVDEQISNVEGGGGDGYLPDDMQLYKCPQTGACDDGSEVAGDWVTIGCNGQISTESKCIIRWWGDGNRECKNNCIPIN